MINLLFNDNMVGESLSPQITRISLIVDNEEIQSEDEDMHEINENLINVDLGNRIYRSLLKMTFLILQSTLTTHLWLPSIH